MTRLHENLVWLLTVAMTDRQSGVDCRTERCSDDSRFRRDPYWKDCLFSRGEGDKSPGASCGMDVGACAVCRIIPILHVASRPRFTAKWIVFKLPPLRCKGVRTDGIARDGRARARGPYGSKTNGRNRNGLRAPQKQLDYSRPHTDRIKGLGMRRLEFLAGKMFDKPLADLSSLVPSRLIDML